MERYCDGGIFANHPSLLGYTEALYHLKIPPGDIQILSVSTPRTDLAESHSTFGLFQRFLLSRGVIGWSTKVAAVLIDATSNIAGQTLRRLTASPDGLGSLYERVALQNQAGIAMDVASRQATEILQRVGSEHAAEETVRRRLQTFFSDSED